MSGLEQSRAKMRDAGQPEGAVAAFGRAYERLLAGDETMLASEELEPLAGVPGLEELPAGAGALSAVASIKLNGGLATTMGLRSPKSLVEAREKRSFLEIIIGQTRSLRARHAIGLPLTLMDSEATHGATLAAVRRHGGLDQAIAVDFLQSMVPKLDAATLAPISWPANPALEWCPPGHGDVYGALARSGVLEALLEQGYRYAMIANADNLGAVPDERIAAHIAREGIPFLMEVVEGTAADRKGGHVARRRADGALVLRETAQTPPEDQESFRDHRRWRYYNTNSLWVDLRELASTLERSGGVLELPLIVNPKTVDPRDPSSPRVIQLESAMGAAIGSFKAARLLCVPRTRFVPVKTTDDLLLLRSDAYALTASMSVEPVPERAARLPLVALDPRYYRLLADFERRFPAGPPSLRDAERLTVTGDVTFGADVVVRGAVALEADQPERIADGTVLGS
ncbi:MAG TPA: UTP--glucose-1-phosphate uridylyltransferase [Solirubrobacteraceae bacterium]|nr:UTP--glucose-1-phosphate uridylyltransferase [Solirubrobacteraceae bacterium]